LGLASPHPRIAEPETGTPEEEIVIRAFRLFTTAAAALGLLAFGNVAGASPDRDLGLARAAGEPGPPHASPRIARSSHARVLGHADPGGGFNGDVVAHRGFAYLASWGTRVPPWLSDFDFCPSQGVRVYDLQDPRNPTQVSTFADDVSEPDLAGTWTEKVIVRHVRTHWFEGDLAAVSIQSLLARDLAPEARQAGLRVHGDPVLGAHDLAGLRSGHLLGHHAGRAGLPDHRRLEPGEPRSRSASGAPGPSSASIRWTGRATSSLPASSTR